MCLFIFWTVLSLCCRAAFLLVAVRGGCSSLPCGSFSLQWLVLMCSTGSRGIGSMDMGFGSRGSPAQLLCSMWDRPRPDIEPVSLALAGRFLTTGRPGKSLLYILCYHHMKMFSINSLPQDTTQTSTPFVAGSKAKSAHSDCLINGCSINYIKLFFQ